MTIREVIDWVDGVKPNAFTDMDKVGWINALEGRLCANVFLMPPVEIAQLRYSYPGDLNTELLVVSPHDDIYIYWLQAKIDEANGEYNKFANTMTIYNEHYGDFVRWFGNLYDPAQGYMEVNPI